METDVKTVKSLRVQESWGGAENIIEQAKRSRTLQEDTQNQLTETE